MQDTASGAQAVPPTPESHTATPIEPTVLSGVNESALPQADSLSQVDSVQPPSPPQPTTPSEPVTSMSAGQANQEPHQGLYALTPPQIAEPIVAPEVKAPKQEVQPTQSMQESLPEGNAALLQRATLEVGDMENKPAEDDANQPITPESAPAQPVAEEQAADYEPVAPPPAEGEESHGEAPQSTGSSMQAIATPEEIAELTENIKQPDEPVAEPLPIEPEVTETAAASPAPAPAAAEIPALPPPEPERKIDFSPVVNAQAAALTHTPQALAEKPAGVETRLDEEDAITSLPPITRSERLEVATDQQLENLIGSGRG